MTVLLSQSLLICYLMLGTLPAKAVKSDLHVEMVSTSFHPLHLSSTEIGYTTKGGTIEISSRLFMDDLESVLSKQFKVPVDLSAPAKHKAMDELLKKYFAMHLKIQGNGKDLALNYIGFEKDREAVVIYMESTPVKALKKLAVSNSLMYDLFDDQTNIMHVTYNGERKSSKLDYPKTNAVILSL